MAHTSDVAGTALLVEQCTSLAFRHLFDQGVLSVTASDLLARLIGNGPMRLTTAAEAVSVSQPSMTQLVQRLEKRGLVFRMADPDDRRAAMVGITDAGRRLLDSTIDDAHKRLAVLLGTLGDEEAAALRLAVGVALPILRRLTSQALASQVAPPASAMPQAR
jgi:DNA-binding MarR family transcriptional regulator